MKKDSKLLVFIVIVVVVIIIGMYYGYIPLNNDGNNEGEACIADGGVWDNWGSSDEMSCNFKTSDFGKRCADSEKCEGRCIGGGQYYIWGECSEWKHVYGCYYFVEDGIANAEECVYFE